MDAESVMDIGVGTNPARSETEERRHVSSLPEFAEIYIFLEIFGPLINLTKINLKELENFFIGKKNS